MPDFSNLFYLVLGELDIDYRGIFFLPGICHTFQECNQELEGRGPVRRVGLTLGCALDI